jgi:hypothetical protein
VETVRRRALKSFGGVSDRFDESFATTDGSVCQFDDFDHESD